MQSALITGSNGFIGRNFIKYLVRKGVRVYAVSRSVEDSSLRDFPNVQLIDNELKDLSELEDLPGEGIPPDTFYHFAWSGTTGVQRADYVMQLENARYVCDAAKLSKKLGCRRFISLGTITEKVVPYAVEHHCVSPALTYAIAKVAASNMLEVVCKAEDIDYIWVRLSNIYGGENTNGNLISYTLEEFKKGRTPSYGPCLQPYNFTYIDDVVEALYLLGDKIMPHESTYFLSNGEYRILKDYITEISEVFQRPIEIGKRADDGIRYEEEWFTDTRIQKDFGFSPKHRFSDAIRMMREDIVL